MVSQMVKIKIADTRMQHGKTINFAGSTSLITRTSRAKENNCTFIVVKIQMGKLNTNT